MRKIRHDLKTWNELCGYLQILSQNANGGGIQENYQRTFITITEMTRAEEPFSGMRGAKSAVLAWWNNSRPSKDTGSVFHTCLGAILLHSFINAVYNDQKDERFTKKK
jgi:hypothetical protein